MHFESRDLEKETKILKAKKIFSEGLLQNHGYQVKFMLQAFGSMWFNELVIKRRKE